MLQIVRGIRSLATMAVPRTVLGVMEFGRQLTEEQAPPIQELGSNYCSDTMYAIPGILLGFMVSEAARRCIKIFRIQSHEALNIFFQEGYNELDCARMYSGGKSEKVLGTMADCRDQSKVIIATKAYPEKGFTYDNVIEHLNTSLKALQVPCVSIFYLHWPDRKSPLEETLRAVNQLYTEGKFKEFGLSNYRSWEVVEIYHICKANGWVLPTVYQGMYNSLTRDIEIELFPALRKFGIRFYAYNPLAGGLLTGRYVYEDQDEKRPDGRFFTVGGKWAKSYRDRYWRKSYFDGIAKIDQALKDGVEEVSLLEASLRWMYHHSKLSAENEDAVILGVSKVPHLVSNLKAIKGGPLHDDVVKAFDDAWNNIKSDCPTYFR